MYKYEVLCAISWWELVPNIWRIPKIGNGVLLPYSLSFLFYFLNKKNYLFYLFIFGCVRSSLWCTGFSLRWLLLLYGTGCRHAGFSSCGSWALESRLGSCGARTWLFCGMWDLPGPGIEPMSPALAGGFSTTAPQGKPSPSFLKCFLYYWIPLYFQF